MKTDENGGKRRKTEENRWKLTNNLRVIGQQDSRKRQSLSRYQVNYSPEVTSGHSRNSIIKVKTKYL